MQLNSNIKGAVLMTGCMLTYVINDAFMKLLFSEIALFQAIFLRSLITVLPILVMTWITKVAIRNLSYLNKRLLLARVSAEICATIAFLLALQHMRSGTLARGHTLLDQMCSIFGMEAITPCLFLQLHVKDTCNTQQHVTLHRSI